MRSRKEIEDEAKDAKQQESIDDEAVILHHLILEVLLDIRDVETSRYMTGG